MTENNPSKWEPICPSSALSPNIGVRALVKGEQVALFNVAESYYAVSAIDPFTQAAVLSRGIVGDLNGEVVVASPVYKQHFSLSSGKCLEDDSVSIKTFPVRVNEGNIELLAS